MQWFYRLGVAAKLLTAFAVLIVLTLGLGVFALERLASVNQTSTDMELNWMPSVRHAGDMNTGTSDFRVAELQHVLSRDEADMARYEKILAARGAALDASRSQYAKLISTAAEQRLYDTFTAHWNDYLVEHRKVLALSHANHNDEARALIRGRSQAAFDAASADLVKIAELNIEGGKAASRRGDILYANARGWMAGVLAGVVLLGIAMAVFIARTLLRQLGGEPARACAIAARIAAGDLTVAIDTRRGDTTSMMYSIGRMRDSLSAIVSDVRGGTETIAAASAQVAAGSMDLSTRTEEQASSLEETASSMEELTTTVKQNADNAQQAQTMVENASAVAAKGGAVIKEVVSTMDDINQAANKIVDIISVIDGIAFQTNILALNAAVEAARAGEQGRGFAVVAGEVRTLAQRSAGAAKEIKALIGDSVTKVHNGSRLVDQAGATMNDIVESVRRVDRIMAEISSASSEQSTGIEQINAAVMQMDQVTQQNAALVEEAAAAAESMQGQAARLLEAVRVFKLSADDGAQSSLPVNAPARSRPAPGRQADARARIGFRAPAVRPA